MELKSRFWSEPNCLGANPLSFYVFNEKPYSLCLIFSFVNGDDDITTCFTL